MATMTRQHFELIARAVKDSREHWTNESPKRAIDGVAETLADALAKTNSNFDRARFLTACGA